MVKKTDFVSARGQMVLRQLKRRDIIDRRVLKVMGEVPREEFLPSSVQEDAYIDWPVVIGQGQTISQPYTVALMTQLLKLKGQEKVLEIGTGSGYQAAILAKLANKVYTIERHQSLLRRAREVFNKLKYKNIISKLGDGSKGWKAKAPFDRILITAAAERIPSALIAQLVDGGIIVAPIGGRYYQDLVRLTKMKGKLKEENFGGCVFVPLVEEEE